MKTFAFLILISIAPAFAVQDGKALYTQYCSACHAPDGKGTNNGQFPPLAGSEWIQGEADRMIQIILHGLQGPIEVAGKNYNLVMPPQGAAITDEHIAKIATYVRSAWGNKESAVSVSNVKTQRSAPKPKTMMWEAEALLKRHPLPTPKVKGALKDLLSYIHHGEFKSLKDLRASKPVNVEEEKGGLISISHADREDDFGLTWEGWLDVPYDGHYKFYFDTDDGGALTINGQELIKRDRVGPKGKPSKAGIKLKKGRANIKIEYFELKGEAYVSLYWDGPGVKKQVLSESKPKDATTPSIPLVPPPGEAIIYRNFIAGTDARAIAVGYSEGGSLSFSADSMCIDLAWTGKFMDAGRHWTNRGQGFEGPAGQNIISLGRGIPVALLESQTASWPKKISPKLTPRFRGYSLNKAQQPTFRYQFGQIKVIDEIIPATGGKTLTRHLTFTVPTSTRSDETLYYRVLNGATVKQSTSHRFDFQKDFYVEVTNSQSPPFTRPNELLIPIPLNQGEQKVTLTYNWK